MVNILLNDTNFDQKWAYPSLRSYFTKDTNVFVVPLGESEWWGDEIEEWQHHYQKGGKTYEKIVQAFHNYLIKESNIRFFNPYQETAQQFERELKKADVLYLYGKNADHMMVQIEDLVVMEIILKYEGIIMSNDAGSDLLMETFDSPYAYEEECKGLGLLRGFALMSDYIEDAVHLERLIRNIEVKGKNVFAFGKNGGVIIDHDRYELLGDAFIATEDDLDALYQAYEDAKSRLDYYGDNGLW